MASKQLQGNGIVGSRSTSGSFNEYFPVIEVLLDHLELAVRGKLVSEGEDNQFKETDLFNNLDTRTRQLLQVYIRLAWKKMNKTLMTSPAYVAAVVFHPWEKWETLDALWSQLPVRQAKSWKQHYTNSIRSIWESRYKDRDLSNTPAHVSGPSSCDKITYFQRRLVFTRAIPPPNPDRGGSPRRDFSTEQDELTRYLCEPVVNAGAYQTDPSGWWKGVGALRFPRLSYMAVDLLIIPSSSAETERCFSSAGRMMTPLRSRLKRSSVARAQCLRSWSKAGIYVPNLPFPGLEEVSWRQVVQAVAAEDSI